MQGAYWTADLQAPSNDAQGLFVRFHMGATYDPVASKAAGHPKFKDEPYIMLAIPGDKSTVVDRPVRKEEDMEVGHANEADTVRFQKAWEAFCSGKGEDIQSGTPLAEWAVMTRAQVEELAHFKIRTVEQLANLTDANAQRFMGSLALRQKARDWLAQAQKAAPLNQLREEMDAKVQAKDAEVEILKEQLAELQRVVAERTEKTEQKRKAG